MSISNPSAPNNSNSSRVNIKDVARAAGTAVSTVSRALNGHPDVSEETRHRIVAIAEQMGFQQNHFARSLIHGRSSLVAIVANQFHSEYKVRILQGVATAARGLHLELLLTFTPTAGEVLPAYTSLLQRSIVSGALVVSPVSGDEDELLALQKAGFPTVVINPATRLPGLSSIEPTNFEGFRMVTRHLLELGHREIAVVACASDYAYGRERLEGYEAALREFGLGMDPRLMAVGGIECKSVGQEAIVRWLDEGLRFTAVACYNDLIAYEVMEELSSRGIHVPRDVSVVGFDDLPVSRYVGPGLTTVSQPIDGIGQRAMHMLADLLDSRTESGEHVRIDTNLVIRGSTEPPRSP